MRVRVEVACIAVIVALLFGLYRGCLFGINGTRKQAVDAGAGEWFINELANKDFRWLIKE